MTTTSTTKLNSVGVTPPASWQIVQFGDVVRDVKESEKNPLDAGLDRFVGLEHIEPDHLHLTKWGDLTQDDVSFTKRFRKGQVLFGKRRAYQRKVVIAEFDGICSSDILTFEPKTDELLSGLLPFIVRSDAFFEHALGTSSGSISPRTRWSQLREFELRLPPREEQRRICEILWTADEAVASKREVLDAARNCQAAVAAHLVTCGMSKGKTKNSEIGRVPGSWDVCRLPSVVKQASPITYGIVQPGERDPGGVLMVLGGDFINGWVDKSTMFRVNPSLHQQYRRSLLSPRDLIMCIVGVTTGAVAIVPDWGEEANLTQTSARISCDERKMLPEFLLAYLQSPFGKRFVCRYLKGSRQVRLNIGDFEHFWVPVPPLDEQLRIIEVLMSLHHAVSRAKQSLEMQIALAKSLSSNLLSGADV
ncbi:MAG: restriction endonuclease subunit S [Planctomycetota bacterium]|nr:MAG: restriction endonuclease subunit S [Planctomycetota bacterium]REJ87319.1 MAG: restriction endonuclease subunit S [Planctomycetota bacterium]REK22668.1 MAG: restriction endonuclease subunit S [Planctomycetota bacterium]REK42499.1 MAG: restriction endonuclease subunit S [Planctomycetota bacterium]